MFGSYLFTQVVRYILSGIIAFGAIMLGICVRKHKDRKDEMEQENM